jgi:hypothetical protein
VLLLVTGQTIIFLLRLVAADRRGRRRPLASGTPTVGELEDAEREDAEREDAAVDGAAATAEAPPELPAEPGSAPPPADPTDPEGPVRQ